ncbi:MAG: hypothetical protein ACI8P2_004751, partial [Candidatus Latescibacterota bacterium]
MFSQMLRCSCSMLALLFLAGEVGAQA